MDADIRVVEKPELHRFELPIEDSVAVVYYRLDGDRLVLTHTEVPQEYLPPPQNPSTTASLNFSCCGSWQRVIKYCLKYSRRILCLRLLWSSSFASLHL